MSKVTNTSKNPRLEWLMGGNPNAIEAQEAAGQVELVKSQQLPVNGGYHSDNTKSLYEAMGIKVLGVTEGDPIFYDVILPEGWSKKPTDHSMYVDFLDSKGQKRALIFYKAAFYDRDAEITFYRRYEVVSRYPRKDEYKIKFVAVIDNVTGQELAKSDEFENTYGPDDPEAGHRSNFAKYLDEIYPDWKNPAAYWD